MSKFTDSLNSKNDPLLKGLNVFLVGGAVRDKLLNLPHQEKDWVVVGSTETEMIQRGFFRVGKDFPVFLHPETKEEYALARTERKKGKGYYGFECYAAPDVTLEEDLLRRDLTINAMAEDAEGKIIDPFLGQKDLEQKNIRHVSPAFAEDPVRILRIARFMSRFAPLGFKIDPKTQSLMHTMVLNGEVDALVPERVWQEMYRALNEKDPTQFFIVLHECGALARLWPALDKLWGVPQPLTHHPEGDTGKHIMLALHQARVLTSDPEICFALLCHDLGKGMTDPKEWPSHIGHEEAGVPLIQQFCKQYRIPKDYRELAILVCRYHLHCHRAFELKPSTLLKTLEALDAFRRPERFQKFLLACECDAKGRTGRENCDYPQANHFRKAYEAAKNVDIQPLVEAGLTGEALKQKLHQLRVNAIKKELKIE